MSEPHALSNELEPARQPWRPHAAWVALTVGVVVFTCLFPRQVPFIQDEPMLLEKALRLNSQHTLATIGLVGSLGRPYGPVALWLYQALLLITHDPVKLVVLRAALVSGSMAGGLLWIARSTRLTAAVPPLILAAPFVWFYSRHLWDNSLNLALGSLLLGCYAAWLRERRPLMLSASVVLTAAMLLVHLMATPVALAVAAHALWRARPTLLKQWRFFAFGLVIALAISFQYALKFFGDYAGYATHRSVGEGLLLPLKAPGYFSATGLDYLFFASSEMAGGPASYLRNAGGFSVAIGILTVPTMLAWAVVPGGLLRVAWELARGRRRRRAIGGRETEGEVGFEMALLAGMTAVIAVAFHGATQTYGTPYYHNGSFIAYAMLLWYGIDGLVRGTRGPLWRIAARALIAAYGICLMAITVMLLARIMQTDGTRGINYGPTLGTQLDAARTYRSANVVNQTDLFDHAIEALRLLNNNSQVPRGDSAGVSRHGATMVLRYASGDPHFATIEVVPANVVTMPSDGVTGPELSTGLKQSPASQP